MPSPDQYRQPAVNDRHLLDALPHPTAVFRVVDGCMIAANHHFYTTFKWPIGAVPEDCIASFNDITAGPDGTEKPSSGFHIRTVHEGYVQLETPDGCRRQTKGDALPCRYDNQACWLLTMDRNGENPPGNAPFGKASTGSAAVELFQRQWKTIDLVILDMILPDMRAGDICRTLKAIDPEAKVLLSSGFSRSDQVEALLGMGCRGFIQKPYDINHLSAKAMSILSAV